MAHKKGITSGTPVLDFKHLKLKGTPNEYLVAPDDLCQDAVPHRPADIYDVPSTELRDAIMHVVSRQSRVELSGMNEEAKAFEFVHYSAVLNFKDFISVRVLPHGHTQSTIAIFSRSKTGYYDFGVNRKRVEAWLEELEGEIIR
ncbi:DUF1499 domain-containing protein [Pyruvatibacter sp.]|uniref:DUF1499 domain-containing protein n=1 Tax=Pyruvatibacter sp. TaxID=1981328 RepID=UPI0032EEE0A7